MKPRSLLATVLALLLGAAVTPVRAGAQPRTGSAPPVNTLALDRYLDYEEAQDARLSPDGRTIVYVRRSIDATRDRWRSSIWAVQVDGNGHRRLVDGSSPRWSRDGRLLAYLAPGEPSGTQLYVLPQDGSGEARQLTRGTHAPEDIAWSPDGRSIAFRMFMPSVRTSAENWRVTLAKPEGAEWTPEPRIIEHFPYREDRVGFLEEGFRQLYLVAVEGSEPRQLTDGEWNAGRPSWSADGQSLLFSSRRFEVPQARWRESEVYSVDVRSREVRQLTRRQGPDQNPVASPDGRFVAYTGFDHTDDTYTAAGLYVMGSDGSSPTLLTTRFDRQPDQLFWAADGSGVYFTADSDGSNNLYFAARQGGVRPVTTGKHVLRVTDLGRDGIAVGVRSDPQRPPDVVLFQVRRPTQLRQVTALNEDLLAGVRLGEVEELWYASADGLRIQGWIVKPPHFEPSRKYPLMLSIHGGPHAMYGVGFSYAWQEHAANGYVVLYTNPRGSTGYGSAFGNAIKHAYPGKDYDDLMAGVDTLVRRGYIDADNLFVYGCSGGGLLTAWTVTQTDRFRAAAALCPVINWLSFTGVQDGIDRASARNFPSWPWEDPTPYLARSPLMHVGKVKTPTMLMTGILDLRTPMSQSEEFYQALTIRGVPTALVRLEQEWHGTTSRPSNFMRTQLYLRRWFERWGTHDERRAPASGSGDRD